MGGRFLRDIGRGSLVAAAYFGAGWLGLLLAVPPGFATAVWPPSGIALAAVLLAGHRVAPGIWLGSFLLNLVTAADGAGSPWAATLLPLVIATGATLQAVVGAALIRRLVGYSNILVEEQNIVPLLLLGGPVACVINTALSIAALRAFDLVPADAILFNAWTWWIGDSIGVFVFTPLILVWAVRPYGEWLGKQIFVTVPLALLFGIVVTLFVFISHREQARVKAEFDNVSQDVAQHLQKRLNSTVHMLGSLEGLYATVDEVEPYQFEIFASRLLLHMDGVEALSWNSWIPGEGRALPPPPLVAPRDSGRRAAGLDLAPGSLHREALDHARDTGLPIVTGGLPPADEHAAPRILVLMAAYRHGSQPRTLVARRKYLRGFVAAAFDVDDLMKTTLELAAARGLTVRLHDDAAPKGGMPLLYDGGAEKGRALTSSVALFFAGRPWRLELVQPESLGAARSSWQVWLVLAAGLALTSLVGILLLTAQGRTARVEALVAARTAELRKLNLHLTGEVQTRARLESDAAQRANELAEKNIELERRDEITRELLRNQRRSEGELRRTAGRLAASNRELEQFAYVASHDLKAPLRSVASFAQLLGKRHGAGLKGEALEFLGFIGDGIRHMQELIDDLLQLSRVATGKLEVKPVSASQLVEQACRLLAADIAATQARVHAQHLPEIVGDARLLTQVLQNLIGNALKFRVPDRVPEIWIEASGESEHWHFKVRDNGIGIESRYLDQIFLIFKRLHTQEQYPGNGIGLAICLKVMQLHGGEIWAESSPGGGTTFHFTVPRRSELGAERVAA